MLLISNLCLSMVFLNTSNHFNGFSLLQAVSLDSSINLLMSDCKKGCHLTKRVLQVLLIRGNESIRRLGSLSVMKLQLSEVPKCQWVIIKVPPHCHQLATRPWPGCHRGAALPEASDMP